MMTKISEILNQPREMAGDIPLPIHLSVMQQRAQRVVDVLQDKYGWDKLSTHPDHPYLELEGEKLFIRNWDEKKFGKAPNPNAL